jgi:hypothetical protein
MIWYDFILSDFISFQFKFLCTRRPTKRHTIPLPTPKPLMKKPAETSSHNFNSNKLPWLKPSLAFSPLLSLNKTRRCPICSWFCVSMCFAFTNMSSDPLPSQNDMNLDWLEKQAMLLDVELQSLIKDKQMDDKI